MSFTKNLFSNFHINSPSTNQRILTSSPSIKSNFQTKTLSKTQIRRVYIAMIQKKFGKSRPLKKQQISLVRRSEMSLFSEDLTCPICLDIFVNPVSTTCGHNFCLICYQTVISQQNKSCPCCRSQIQRWEIFQNPSVNRLVCQLIKTLTTDEQVQYKKRQSLCKRKIKRRSVDSKLKVGELVDIKNLQDCWEIGEIIKMSTKRKRIYIQVQSANNDKIYTLDSKSFSIARFGYHTCSNSTTFSIKNYQNYQNLLPQQISQPSIQIDYDQPEILSIGNQLVSNIQILLNGISNLDSKRLRILQDRYLNELLMFD